MREIALLGLNFFLKLASGTIVVNPGESPHTQKFQFFDKQIKLRKNRRSVGFPPRPCTSSVPPLCLHADSHKI